MRKRKIFSGIVCCALICFFLAGCGSDEQTSVSEAGSAETESSEEQEYTQNFFAMDTFMTLTAYGEQAEEAVEAGMAEIERLDTVFSTGDADSEISAVNAAGGGTLSEEVASVIRRALEIGEATDGIFDISIYPVMKLWGFTDGNYQVPEEEELAAALSLVNAGDVTLSEEDGTMVLSMADGMEIDLGGIVKGYADDRVAEIFASYGIEDAIINLGGDVRVMGTRPDGSLWRVGIQDPDDSNGYIGGLELTNMAVVTSGGYERYFEDEETGTRYHHIIDPRTGVPADNGLVSVSVVSEDGTLADALSTTLFILGSEEAVDYCEAHCVSDGFEALLMTQEGELYITEGLEDSFIDLTGDTTLQVIETR